MQDVARIVGLVMAGLVLVLVGAAAWAYAVSESRLTQHVALAAADITIPTDIPSIQRGQHLASAVALCNQCHGSTLGGRVLMDDSSIGRIVASNLTRGRGGVGTLLSDADILRAVRDGVDPSGRLLLLMPSDNYNHFSDADLADIVAYVRSVAAVDSNLPSSDIRPVGRLLFAAGQLPLIPAESIDRGMPRLPTPAPSVSPEYGAYLVQAAGCATCHGPGLSGGRVPQGARGSPPAANLTPSGLGQWSEADFLRAMRTGVRPDGRTLDTLMPWPYFAQMSDDELRAIWRFLEGVPPRQTGSR
jgi:cytochrome c553